jgi:hypothetical protein
VHGTIDRKSLENLPQATRTYEELIGQLPGVTPPSASSGGTNNPLRSMAIQANGTSSIGTNVSIKGINATNPWVQFYSTAVPSTEAVQTVNVVTASSGADQGAISGAAIQVQIKSGTNALHGEAYEYFMNNTLQAKPYFNPAGQRNAKYIDNNFGGTLGGPIVKNKLFYFVSYESDRLRKAAGGYYTLPTPDMLSGKLKSPTPIFDPSTGNADGQLRKTFPQDPTTGAYLIPVARFDSITNKLLANVPSGVQNGVYTNNIYINTPYSYDLQKIDSKVDWNATSKLRVVGRYSDYPYKQLQAPAFEPILGGGGYNTNQTGNIYALSGSATYVISPRLVADATFGLTHSTQNLYAPLYNQRYGSDVLGIPNTNLGPLPTAGGVPQFNFGLSGWGYGYPSLVYADPIFEYTGNFTWIKGNHNFRFGIDVSQQHMNHKEVNPTAFNFTGGLTGLYCAAGSTDPNCENGSPGTSQFNSFADFLLGLPQNAQNSELTENWVTLRTWQFAPYFSDTWQVNRQLTLYVGTGWNFFPPPNRENRGLEIYDPSTNVYEICGEGNVPRNCGVSVQKYLFAPRIGVAYRVSPRFVVRTGYSLTPEQNNMYRDSMYNYPETITQNISGENSYTAAATLDQGFPTLSPPDISSGVVPLPPTVGVAVSPKHFIRGYTESENLSVQGDLGRNFVAQVAYVGTLTIHQHTNYNINYGTVGGGQASQQLYKLYGITAQETVLLPLKHANYHSLQAQLQKRLTNGLQFQANYTWSRWMGLCCDANGDISGPQIPIPQYFHLNYAVMPGDRTNNLQFNAIYELPFGKGKPYLTNGAGTAIAGGWQFSTTLAFYSGTPFGISAPANSLNAPGSPQRADQIKSKVAIYGPHGLVSPYFDISAFAPVTQPRFGTAAFDSLRGPGFANMNASLYRTFPVHENLHLQFRADALNLTNHPNFNNPDNGVSDTSFGLINSTNSGSGLIAQRNLRMGLKLLF